MEKSNSDEHRNTAADDLWTDGERPSSPLIPGVLHLGGYAVSTPTAPSSPIQRIASSPATKHAAIIDGNDGTHTNSSTFLPSLNAFHAGSGEDEIVTQTEMEMKGELCEAAGLARLGQRAANDRPGSKQGKTRAAQSKQIRAVISDSEEDEDNEEYEAAPDDTCRAHENGGESIADDTGTTLISMMAVTPEALAIMKGLHLKVTQLRARAIQIHSSTQPSDRKLLLNPPLQPIDQSAELERQNELATRLEEYAEEIDYMLDDGVGPRLDVNSAMSFTERALAMTRYADGLAVSLDQADAQAKTWLAADEEGKENMRAETRRKTGAEVQAIADAKAKVWFEADAAGKAKIMAEVKAEAKAMASRTSPYS